MPYEQHPSTLGQKYSCDNCKHRHNKLTDNDNLCAKCIAALGEDKFPKWEKKD